MTPPNQHSPITATDVLAWFCGLIILLFGHTVHEPAILGTGILLILVNTCHVCTR